MNNRNKVIFLFNYNYDNFFFKVEDPYKVIKL